MLYKDKVQIIKSQVNFGMNYKALDFIKDQLALSVTHPDYEDYIKSYPEIAKYINNILIMYRKQISGFPISEEIRRLRIVKIYNTRSNKQLQLF